MQFTTVIYNKQLWAVISIVRDTFNITIRHSFIISAPESQKTSRVIKQVKSNINSLE